MSFSEQSKAKFLQYCEHESSFKKLLKKAHKLYQANLKQNNNTKNKRLSMDTSKISSQQERELLHKAVITAFMHQNAKAVVILLEFGAPFEPLREAGVGERVYKMRTKSKKQPLDTMMYALKKNYCRAVAKLLMVGPYRHPSVNLNIRDSKTGLSPLHCAVLMGFQAKQVMELVTKGLNPRHLDKQGKKAADYVLDLIQEVRVEEENPLYTPRSEFNWKNKRLSMRKSLRLDSSSRSPPMVAVASPTARKRANTFHGSPQPGSTVCHSPCARPFEPITLLSTSTLETKTTSTSTSDAGLLSPTSAMEYQETKELRKLKHNYRQVTLNGRMTFAQIMQAMNEEDDDNEDLLVSMHLERKQEHKKDNEDNSAVLHDLFELMSFLHHNEHHVH